MMQSMKRYTRVAGNGIAPLAERVRAAGLPSSDLSAILWNAAWSRGCDEIDVLIPEPGFRIEGFVLYARSTFEDEHILLLEAQGKVHGFIARGATPPIGARVRIAAGLTTGGGCWNVAVTERLGGGITVSFVAGTDAAQHGWVESARAVLRSIVEAEAQRRLTIDATRRALPIPEPVLTLPDDLRMRHAALIARVDSETAPTPAERATLERAPSPVRRALLADITARRLARYRSDVQAFQAMVPALVAEREARINANTTVRIALQALEDDAARSRALGERAAVALHQLDTIERASLCISGFNPASFPPGDQPAAGALIQSIALLFAIATNYAG